MRFPQLFWIVLLALSMRFGHATSVRPLELEDLVRQSYQIFIGRVIAARADVLPDFNLEYTEYTIAVSDWIKGGGAETVKIRQLGKSGGALLVPGLPRYRKGEEVLLFIHQPSQIGLTSPVGMQQGYYRIERGANGERFVRAAMMMPSILRLTSRSKSSDRPPPDASPADRVSLQEFLSVVRRIQ